MTINPSTLQTGFKNGMQCADPILARPINTQGRAAASMTVEAVQSLARLLSESPTASGPTCATLLNQTQGPLPDTLQRANMRNPLVNTSHANATA